MLSNTATPIYYAAFREKVQRGEIPVCEEISMEMNRIDALIADPSVYYSDSAIEGFIEFCEEEMTLTDGGDVHLLDSFKLWAEALLSWFIFVERRVWDNNEKAFVVKTIKKRLIDMQYLIVARGSAKSMYVAFLQAYFLTVDRSTTHQITVAPTMKQAEEVLSPIKTAITRAKGPLMEFLTDGSMNNTTGARSGRQKLASTKKGIENFLTNSLLEIRPMSIDKCQGLRTKYASVDEWLSGDTREDVITALMQGARKFEDPVLIAISSEGTVRNGVGDTIKMELSAILRGDMSQPNVSIFHYKLDDVKEVKMPEMWAKANPNLGITVSYETYQQDVERAEQFPAVRNEILAKRFGLPMEGFTFFFTYEETLVHTPKQFKGLPCSLGIDLSRGDDFTAFTFFVPAVLRKIRRKDPELYYSQDFGASPRRSSYQVRGVHCRRKFDHHGGLSPRHDGRLRRRQQPLGVHGVRYSHCGFRSIQRGCLHEPIHDGLGTPWSGEGYSGSKD